MIASNILFTYAIRYGSLYDLLRNETILLAGDELYHIFRDIVSGVLYLHSVDPQIIHGDIKAAVS